MARYLRLGRSPWRHGSFGDDEKSLSGPDEPEVATRQFFDGGWVVAEALGLVRQLAILSPEPVNGVGQLQVLTLGAHGLDKPSHRGRPTGRPDLPGTRRARGP